MNSEAKFDAIPTVDIDTEGRFKYILIKVYSGKDEEFKYITRGYAWAEYHGNF